jgi:tetratricopeptide (TPR) repeat protein
MTLQAVEIGRALIESPDSDVSAFALTTSLLVDELGDSEEAVRVAERGLVRYPGDASLINNLAYALLMLDRVEAAAAVLERIPESLDHFDDIALTATRGLLALKQGDVVRGSRLYEQALGKATAERTRARLRAKRDLEVGRALVRRGEAGQAAKLFARALTEGSAAAPYQLHAARELKRLRP